MKIREVNRKNDFEITHRDISLQIVNKNCEAIGPTTSTRHIYVKQNDM